MVAVSSTLDGVLGLLDTYGEQSVELNMKKYEVNQRKQQLETELKEVATPPQPALPVCEI